ncbi:hypothetical protein STRAU_3378 [Streptomyces aurantiacus JA 4570]|uniref:Uncharacterized protein n=1 Tax=Streptomyces aurantiacus JA 4570 TaxID=1286094 RepID=S3ZLA4_9ACTN|nr:hypothetical protein STRAU_3378 [Streptomyces aurantiacus JA 4570]
MVRQVNFLSQERGPISCRVASSPDGAQLPELTGEGVVLDGKLSPGIAVHSVVFQEPAADNCPILTITPDGTLTSHVGAELDRRAEVLNALTSAQTLGGQPLPGTIKALAARQALRTGAVDRVNAFVRDELGWWSGWQEPVTTALMGSWTEPLLSGGSLTPSDLGNLRAEAKEIHRQLTPIWRHKINQARLWSLDHVFGDGLTTYDIATGGPDPYEVLTGALPDNPRIVAVLAQLTPVERAVAMAWANAPVASWTDAVTVVADLDTPLVAGLDPSALGERVRRKLKRLGSLHTTRTAARGRGQSCP